MGKWNPAREPEVKKRYTFAVKKQNKNGFKDPCPQAKRFLGLLLLHNKMSGMKPPGHAGNTPENAHPKKQ